MITTTKKQSITKARSIKSILADHKYPDAVRPDTDKPTRIDLDFARSLIGARCSFWGIDNDSCSTSAVIVDGDALVARVKCTDDGEIFFAEWNHVAIYIDELVRIMTDLGDLTDQAGRVRKAARH